MRRSESFGRRLSVLEAKCVPTGVPRWCLLDCDVEAKLTQYKKWFDDPLAPAEVGPWTAEDKARLARYEKYLDELGAAG